MLSGAYMCVLQNFNILAYTSCIPVESKEISFQAANKTFHHGAVAEVIMARMDGQKGDRISAGVARASVSHAARHICRFSKTMHQCHAKPVAANATM